MTDSASDSDCFESADEGFDDEIGEKDNDCSSQGKNDSGVMGSHCAASGDKSMSQEAKPFEDGLPSGDSLEYRKRPERVKNLTRTVAQPSSNSTKTSLNHQIFTKDIKPEMLIQDITSNLSKNINKGFNTIQQTSSSIKDLVMTSLPINMDKEVSDGFSYDDDDGDDDEEEEEEEEEKVIASHLPDDSEEDKSSGKPEGNLSKSDNSLSSVDKIGESLDPVLETLIDKQCASLKFESVSHDNTSNTEVIKTLKSEKHESQKIFSDESKSGDHLEALDVESQGDSKHEADGTIEENKRTEIEDEEEEEEEEKEKEAEAVEEYDDVTVNKDEKLIEKNDIESQSLNDSECEKNSFDDMGNIKAVNADKRVSNMVNLEPVNVDNSIENSFSNKDGWDTSELDLDGLEIEENSSNISSLPSQNDNKVDDNKNETCIAEDNEGWDDFDFDDDLDNVVKSEDKGVDGVIKNNNLSKTEDNYKTRSIDNDAKWSGWENFGEKPDAKQKSGWTLGGWGVNALLNKATSVTQGISSVLEAGLGAPDPETLAKMEVEYKKVHNESSYVKEQGEDPSSVKSEDSLPALNLFPTFGITNLVAGVTKNIVEQTKVQEIGSKVISGGLDTLENFGKKTMEVLQEGDPGLRRTRALLLDSKEPVLSQVLREAKLKAEMEDKKLEEKQMERLCHFETLFDDFQGLIHLAALEMLSRQCELKLEQIKASLSTKEVEDMIDILNEVEELCVIDEDEFKSNCSTMVDFKMSLSKAVEPLKSEISIQKIVQVYEDFETYLKLDENCTKPPQILFQKVISTLAELTAMTVQQFHKGGELILIKEHRKTVEEADTLLQMTGIVCCEINQISEKFLKLHSSRLAENNLGIEKKIKEETKNAISYIKDAFNLLIPVLQLGAAT